MWDVGVRDKVPSPVVGHMMILWPFRLQVNLIQMRYHVKCNFRADCSHFFSKSSKRMWVSSDQATLLTHLTGCWSNDVRAGGIVQCMRCATSSSWRRVAFVTIPVLGLGLNRATSPHTDEPMSFLLCPGYLFCQLHFVTALHLQCLSGLDH